MGLELLRVSSLLQICVCRGARCASMVMLQNAYTAARTVVQAIGEPMHRGRGET